MARHRHDLGGGDGYGSHGGREMGRGGEVGFFRTHDPMSFIPSDAQSVTSLGTQATYPSAHLGGLHGAYASSIVSQDVDEESVAGGAASASITYSQSDRLQRRLSLGSIGAGSDATSLDNYKGDADYYGAGDDDGASTFSAAISQSSFTTF
ncbi:hypothetical protein L1887_48428 [Cichorium endivia]|nr:hypothetical protein L1887_48428 [Cichorium endivia]